MRAKEACDLLKISHSTLKRWSARGIIRSELDYRDRLVYYDDDVYKKMGQKLLRSSNTVLYCRVPGRYKKHQDQMTEQEEILTSWALKDGRKIDKVYRDYCPSTEWSYADRAGIWELIQDVIHRQVSTVIIESRDRIAAIGWEMIPYIFKQYNVETIVINKGRPRRIHKDELKDDVAEMLTKVAATVNGGNVKINERLDIPAKPTSAPKIKPVVFPEKEIYELNKSKPSQLDDLSDLL